MTGRASPASGPAAARSRAAAPFAGGRSGAAVCSTFSRIGSRSSGRATIRSSCGKAAAGRPSWTSRVRPPERSRAALAGGQSLPAGQDREVGPGRRLGVAAEPTAARPRGRPIAAAEMQRLAVGRRCPVPVNTQISGSAGARPCAPGGCGSAGGRSAAGTRRRAASSLPGGPGRPARSAGATSRHCRRRPPLSGGCAGRGSGGSGEQLAQDPIGVGAGDPLEDPGGEHRIVAAVGQDAAGRGEVVPFGRQIGAARGRGGRPEAGDEEPIAVGGGQERAARPGKRGVRRRRRPRPWAGWSRARRKAGARRVAGENLERRRRPPRPRARATDGPAGSRGRNSPPGRVARAAGAAA